MQWENPEFARASQQSEQTPNQALAWAMIMFFAFFLLFVFGGALEISFLSWISFVPLALGLFSLFKNSLRPTPQYYQDPYSPPQAYAGVSPNPTNQNVGTELTRSPGITNLSPLVDSLSPGVSSMFPMGRETSAFPEDTRTSFSSWATPSVSSLSSYSPMYVSPTAPMEYSRSPGTTSTSTGYFAGPQAEYPGTSTREYEYSGSTTSNYGVPPPLMDYPSIPRTFENIPREYMGETTSRDYTGGMSRDYGESSGGYGAPPVYGAVQPLTQYSSQIPGMPYHTPAPRTMAPQQITPYGPTRTPLDSEFMNLTQADELYKSLHVSTHMSKWSENARMWLAQMILHPLVKHIEEFEQQTGMPFHKTFLALTGTSGGGVTNAPSAVLWTTDPTRSSLGDISRSSYSSLSSNDPQKGGQVQTLIKARESINRYLNVLGSTSQEYVIKRIRILAEGSCLVNYRWTDSQHIPQSIHFPRRHRYSTNPEHYGRDQRLSRRQNSPRTQGYKYLNDNEDFDQAQSNRSSELDSLGVSRYNSPTGWGDPYSTGAPTAAESIDQDQELITDAQILIHLLCTFMDEKLDPIDPTKRERPFTARYFVTSPTKPASVNSNVVIFQTYIHPPHFNLFVDGTTMWELVQGRHNLFHTIVLFVFYIKTKCGGFLQQLNLGASNIQLLRILEDPL